MKYVYSSIINVVRDDRGQMTQKIAHLKNKSKILDSKNSRVKIIVTID